MIRQRRAGVWTSLVDARACIRNVRLMRIRSPHAGATNGRLRSRTLTAGRGAAAGFGAIEPSYNCEPSAYCCPLPALSADLPPGVPLAGGKLARRWCLNRLLKHARWLSDRFANPIRRNKLKDIRYRQFFGAGASNARISDETTK
jgi:hypothetical protein